MSGAQAHAGTPLLHHQRHIPNPSRRAAEASRGFVPIWLPFLLLCVVLVLVVKSLERDARARGVAQIDVTRYDLHLATRYVPPDWSAELERVLLRAREIAVDDDRAIMSLVNQVAALPFVAEVGTPEIVWPDGLSLPVRLHEPVACIRVGGVDFLPVAADGTVLPGHSLRPHPAYGGYLPALGPDGFGEGFGADGTGRAPYAPGDGIVEKELLDALDVARSMWFHLSPEEVLELGPVVIDASRRRAPTARALPGGVVIDLEGQRRILFGRPPRPVEPGELPLDAKWEHVREGLRRLREGPGWRPWDVLDVRFDELRAATREEWDAMERERR